MASNAPIAFFALQTEAPRPQPCSAAEPFHRWVLPEGQPWLLFFRSEDGYLLRFPGLADFRLSTDCREVVCVPVPGVAASTTDHLYLNQILPLVLSGLGRLVFHASAVELGHHAVVFVGAAGRGKSTLAASFATVGYRFLTDDGLVLDAGPDGYSVQPGHPSIRLWDDSRVAVVRHDTRASPALAYTTKSRFPASGEMKFCNEARRLGRIYFLGDGSADRVSLEPTSAGEAFLELVRHSFILDIEDRALIAGHFDQVSALVREPIVFRLDYPRRFDALPEVRAAILRHCDS